MRRCASHDDVNEIDMVSSNFDCMRQKLHAIARVCAGLYILAGIEITLARSPMATGFYFGRAENLGNYFVFAGMASEEFDPNLYFKKVSCLLLVEVIF